MFSQSDKHHKEPMFLHLLHSIYIYLYIYISLRNITLFTHTYSISKIHNLFHLCPAWVIINRIEGSLIDSVYGNAFLEFSVTLKKDSERSGLDWTEPDRTTSDFMY